MKAVFVLLVGLILASAVVGGPLFGAWNPVEEVEECSELTRFREGYSYAFTYKAVTETGVRGVGAGSIMTMTCEVVIDAPEQCRNVLKTTNCRLDESPEFALEMSTYDLTFRMDNGRIVEVLAHPDEPVHILNAKRGILSLIQLDMEADDVDRREINEVSVHGNCSSEMTVTRRDNNDRPRKIEMVTDLNSCVLRKTSENMTRWQSFMDVVMNTTVVDKFINSSKTCSFDVKGTTGEIKGVECTEVHSFWPMNFNSESGVRTSIQQTLINTDVYRLNSFKLNPSNTRSTCIRYEHDPKAVGVKPDDVTADQAIDILKALVKGTRDEVSMDSPRLFGRWRAALEGMNNETIHEVFNRAYNCSEYSETCRNNPDKVKLAREYLLDGLLPCTTMACFSVKNYAIAKGVVPQPLANAWMVSMAFRNYPTLELMSEMLRMAQAKPSQITIFPLSIMVHNYWNNNEELRTSLSLPEPIVETIRWLRSLVGADCNVAPENERLAMIALKAIGNIGEPVERHDELTFNFADKVTPTLVLCARNKQIPRDISKAAIQSMRRFALGDDLRRQVIEKIFKDTTLDVPQRIAAYLITMKANPSVSELTGIWEFLKTEPVNQMKAFCYSHIANVLESSEPTVQEMKKNLRKAMVDDVLPEYPKNLRKYSRYFELSKNLTEPWRNNTVAAQFESDIIFSPESYMPQEVMFHYVLNAFGKSWDMFETGVEMKGFEPIMESIFGPEGFFPEISLQNLFENIDENILTRVRDFAEAQLEHWTAPAEEEDSSNQIFKKKDKLRKKVKRQSIIDIPELSLIHETTINKLNQLHQLVGMETAATDATVFLRLLGNEFGFVSASDIVSIIPYTMGMVEEFINNTKQIPQLLANGLDFNTTRSFVFMDKSFILPTGLGMPLNCSINGTAVVSLRMRSQFSIQLPRIIASGHVAPSGAVEVLATMGIGMPTKVFTGIMANSTVYHSSKIAGNVTVDGTRLRINLNNTERPMALFNYSTTYNLLKANGDVEFVPGVLQDAVRTQRCTNVSKVFGVDLCVGWAYPNASYVAESPRFPFAGPNSFNVTLVNTDKALKAYTIDMQYKQIKEGGKAKPTSFGSVGKKSTTTPITTLIETLRFSFYAPGEELTRNVTSFLSIDRLRKTAKWTFTVPEVKNFVMFGGIINETTESASAYRAVFNVSAAENTASVDFLIKNESTVAQKNLTTVFNASVNSLYWATVGQFVRQSSSGDWNAHVTETYYWDNETPLYKQLLFPWTGYAINHEKYQTTEIVAERRTDGPTINRDLRMATLGWAFNVDTRQTVSDDIKELALSTKISNATLDFPLFDISLRNESTVSGYRMEATVSRKTHHAFASYDVIKNKQTRVTNRNFRTGVRTDVFVSNPEAAMFMNSPMLLRLFGETALIDEPIVVDGGVDFTIREQSDEVSTGYLVETTFRVPNPRNPTAHLTYDFNLHLQNASLNAKKDYRVELTLPFPLLKMTHRNLIHITADCEDGCSFGAEHLVTLFDDRYNKVLASTNNSFIWNKPAATWLLTVETPSNSYFQNYTAAYTREDGLQYSFEYNQDNSISDLLDLTEITKMSLKPTAASMYWSYIHKLMSYNVSNDLRLGGPVTEMRPVLVPMIVRSVLNKTISKDFAGARDIVLNKLLFNITSSSITLNQSANFTSPIVANASASHFLYVSLSRFDHKLSFNAEQRRLNISAGLNHSLVIDSASEIDGIVTLKTEGRVNLCRFVQMSTLTTLNTNAGASFLTESRLDSYFVNFRTISDANGNVGDNKKINLVANHNTSVSSRLGALEVNGNYNIDNMESAFNFNEMTGVMSYRLASRFIKSSLNSSVSLSTFRKIFKFNRVLAKFSHDIKSNFVNWDAQGQSLLEHFSSITEFDEVSNSLEASLRSKFATASHSSAMALRNMNGFVQFEDLTGHIRNNITSRFVNSTYETAIDFNNVESLVSFTRLGGSSNYVLSSKLMNVTANNTVELNGFRSMFNFDAVNGTQLWFVKTCLLNATMDNAMALNGFRKVFNFDEVSAHACANVTTPIAVASTKNALLIQNVESITSVAKVAFESASSFVSRPVNTSFTNEFAVTNHRSFLDFDSISSTMNFTSKVFNITSMALNELNFNGIRSFVNFDAITHSLSIATNSYYFNTSVNEAINLNNFRKFNQFNLASAEVAASFVTPIISASYQQINKVENMNGWFEYPLAENVIMGNVTTKFVNASASYVGRLVNMRAPFAYDNALAKIEYSLMNRFVNVTGFNGLEINNMRAPFEYDNALAKIEYSLTNRFVNVTTSNGIEINNMRSPFNYDNALAKIEYALKNRLVNVTGFHGIQVNNMRGIFNFDRINGTISHKVITPFTDMVVGGLLEMANFESLFNFRLFEVSTSNIFSITPLTTTYATYNARLALEGFEKFNKFAAINGFSRAALLTKYTNWTINAESQFSNFRSFLDFDSLVLAAQNEFYSPLYVVVMNTTNDVTGSTGFFKANAAQTKTLFSISSRIGKIESGAWWNIADMNGLTRFSASNVHANLNVSTILIKTGSVFGIEMNNYENLTNYGKFELYAANDILTRIATWKVKSGFRLDNMAGILTYSHVEGSASSNFNSIISSFNTSINAYINNQAGLLTYDEMVVSTLANFSSRPLKWQAAAGYNVQNMAGFMIYDSIYASASSNMTSKIYNTTAITSLTANAGTGLFKVQLANVTGSVSVSTPFTREIRAASSAQITNSRKLFNFDEVNMISEGSFLTAKINITANARSTLTNFVNITQFESVDSSADFAVQSCFLNSTSRGIMELRGFQRLFRFQKVRIGGYSVIKSILANSTTEAGIEFTNFRKIFTFERINSSAIATIESKFASIVARSGMELNNFNGLTTFERFNGSFITNFNSKFINTTAGAGYKLEGFRSLFSFDTVKSSAEAILTNRFINGSAMASYALTDSTCFCQFAKLTARSGASFITKFATGNAQANMEIINVRNITSFDQFNATLASRFVSKPITALGEATYTIKNQQQLFKFENVQGRTYGNIKSRFFNATAMLETQMNNSRSLFGFDGAKTTASLYVLSPVSAAYIQGNLNLINFINITHYNEFSGMVAGNVSSPIARASAFSNFNVSNMHGVMTFEKLNTESFGTVESRFINTTIQNSVNLKGFRLFGYDSIGHRFNFYWVDPVSELAVKNGLDMKSIKDMSQLYNVTWMNPKGTVVFTQRLNYENLLASIKVPSIGLVTAGANLNSFGDILTFYIQHELLKDNFKPVQDVTWMLRLNESNVIYSNFSWNPETVAEIVEVTVGALNSTFNRTFTIANSTITKIMEVANRTLTHTRRLTNCTKCFMRYTMMVANDTLRATLGELNQTMYVQALKLNETLYAQAGKLNETFRAQLKKLNATFYAQLAKLNETVIYARSNPREFVNQYVNLTRLNETVRMINATVRELYTKLRYNVSHPVETLENIKTLIKYEQRLEQIKTMIENRNAIKEEYIERLMVLRTNLMERAKVAITDLKEYIRFDEAVERVVNYVETRFNVPKIQEKIAELKLKMQEIREKMAELKVLTGEKVNALKLRIQAINISKEMVKAEIKAEIMARIELIKEFVMYYLNSTTLEAIQTSIFIDFNDDALVQDLMRKVIRIRPRNAIDFINKDNVRDSVSTSVVAAKEKMLETRVKIVDGLRLLNQTTFRYANKTFLNETAKQVSKLVAKQAVEIFKAFNTTLHELVYVDVIKGDIQFVLNLTKEKIQNITIAIVKFTKAKTEIIKAFLKEKWDARPRSVAEVMELLVEAKEIIREVISVRYNVDIDEVAEKVITEMLKRRDQIEMIISEIIAISKNETHPINMLPLCYFNRTIYQIVQPPVNMTTNLTVYYGKMAANFSKVYGKIAVNLTKVYSRLAMEKGMAMTKKYVPIMIAKAKEYKLIAIEKSQLMKELSIVYFNMAKGNATLYYNIAKGNVTLYYQKYAPIVNETIRNYTRKYTALVKQVSFDYAVKVRNVTSRLINVTIEFIEPHVAPYRVIVMEKVELMKVRAANLKERVRQLPAQTEQFLMEFAEYHIERYPMYKQKTIEKIEELKIKLEELKVNITRLSTELKVNMTRLYGELKQNATEAYIRLSVRAQELYNISRVKFQNYSMQAKQQWAKMKPIIINKSGLILNKAGVMFNATKLRVNMTVEQIIATMKDEFSLVNELPMRVLEKTIYELTMELNEYIREFVLDTKTKINECIRSRECLLNKYPVMYLNMTVFEAGNKSFEQMLVATNLTKFYANKTMLWANTSLARANETFYDIMIVSNKTMREIVIPFFNQTTRDVVAFLNRTRTQSWNATIEETIAFLNRTSAVLKSKANETFILVRTKAIEGWKNLTSEESILKMKAFLNNTKDYVISSMHRANETIFMLRNKSMEIIIYIRDETPLINMTREYALLARNFTQETIVRARNMSRNTVILARNMTNCLVTYVQGPVKDYTMQYVQYMNNTMAGWAIRYYEVDQIPSRLFLQLKAIRPREIAGNLTVYAYNQTRLMSARALNRTRIVTAQALNYTGVYARYAINQTRVMTQVALNKTRVLTLQAINRTRTLIRDTLNTIGRLDDHSFAMNISHPFNWTSFRTVPRLSNSQIQYIKDKMVQLNTTVLIPAIEKLQELRVNLTERYNTISTMAMEYYEMKRPIVEAKVEEFRVKLMEKIDEYKALLEEYKMQVEEKWESEWKPALLERKEELMEMWEEEIRPEIDEFVSDLKEFITDIKEFVKDPEMLTKLKEKVRYFKNEYLPELKREIMEEKIPELKRWIVEEKYPEMKEIVLAKYEIGQEIFEEFKHNMTVFRQDMEVRVQKLRVQAVEMMTQLREQLAEFKQNWPETYKKLKADIEDLKIQVQIKITTFINKVLSIMSELRIPVEILPIEHITLYSPWKYTSMIFGENHVMTFDGKVYSIPAYSNEIQTYVLAHDFFDRNFTLLAQKSRITLLVRNMSVAIDSENVVYINGRPSLQELPYQTPFTKELTVMRMGPWVNVTSSQGIALSCHQEHFMCIFHLSGWYHGKSRGLLGNLDTEHHNEFIMPEGEVTEDLAEFISAYDVSPSSMSRNVIPSRLGACFAAHEKCRALFMDENSILNETFSLINKTEFFNLCVKETGHCRTSCEASNPAVTLGKELNANVTYDPECLDCMPNEISQEVRRATSSADIIFVISETSAIVKDNNLESNLKTIINRIRSKLSSYNITDTKFGLVAYGGADIHGKPHIHTLCGNLMDSSLECAQSGIDSLVFQGGKPIDAMHAIQLAASYPFRKNSAKIINLIADEELMEESGKPWDFIFNINTTQDAMVKLLGRQGITFNVFSDYSTLNKDTSESPILGVNYLGKQIIKKKNSGEEGSDRLAIPKGQYAKLAKATRGSIIGLSWLQNGHRDMTFMLPKVLFKQIQPQFAGQVDYNCRCTLGLYGESRTECQISRFVDGLL